MKAVETADRKGWKTNVPKPPGKAWKNVCTTVLRSIPKIGTRDTMMDHRKTLHQLPAHVANKRRNGTILLKLLYLLSLSFFVYCSRAQFYVRKIAIIRKALKSGHRKKKQYG
jgi:hypothetical protein